MISFNIYMRKSRVPLIFNFLAINQFLSHQNDAFTSLNAVDKKLIFQSLDLPSPFLHLDHIIWHSSYCTRMSKRRQEKEEEKSFYSSKTFDCSWIIRIFHISLWQCKSSSEIKLNYAMRAWWNCVTFNETAGELCYHQKWCF